MLLWLTTFLSTLTHLNCFCFGNPISCLITNYYCKVGANLTENSYFLSANLTIGTNFIMIAFLSFSFFIKFQHFLNALFPSFGSDYCHCGPSSNFPLFMLFMTHLLLHHPLPQLICFS
jgi:hypothetical protein